LNLDHRLLRQAWAARAALTAAILLGFLGGVFIIFQASVISQVIGRVFVGRETLETVEPLLFLLLGIIIVRASLAFFADGAAGAVAMQVKNNLRRLLAERLFTLGPAYVEGQRSGEVSTVLVDGVEALDAYFSQYLPQLVLAAAIPLAILVVVFPLDLLTGVVLLVTAPLIPLFMILIGKTGERLTHRQWSMLSRLSAHFLDTLQGLTTLKLLDRSHARGDEIEDVSERYRIATMNVLRVTFLSALALELVATISTAVVAVEIGLRLLAGRIGFEQGFFLLLLAPEFYLPIRMLGQRFHAGMSGVSAAVRIFEILDHQASPQKSKLPIPYISITHHDLAQSTLRFDRVSFTYPQRDMAAVHDISFDLPPDEQVALVGASGAGKSTLAMLLLRFIEPVQGTICMGDRNIAEIVPEEWHSLVAWVPQQPHLFNMTIADNLRLGKPYASMQAVRQAARLSLLDEWIQSLPAGYETWIGEGGARLSGGQAQRLALARAFLKDAPLLVMDEPTAHLDPEQESLLEEAVRRLCERRRVLLIAHRLPTIYRSDRILFVSDGRIVESGTHSELYRQAGGYYRLVHTYQEQST
jgi:ATP-binding cassette, subfamily C, bacterial CydD